jgi:hypothetical protein
MTRYSTAINDDGALYCRKCQHYFGRLIHGVFTVGGVQLYGRVKYFCATCGTPYIYV